MKQNKTQLTCTMVSLGAVLLALRLWLYTVAVDEKGLLLSNHWLSPVIWAVAAVCLAISLMAALRTEEKKPLSVGGPIAALGDGLFALTICLSLLTMEAPATMVEILCKVLGWVSAPSLLYAAACRAKGKPVFFGCFCVVCVFFALYLVDAYQSWSATPQLQDYVFAMGACMGTALFAYQSAALAVGIGSGRVWLAAGLLTVAFGLAAVYRGEPMLLYVGMTVWTLTGLLGDKKTEEN